MWQQIKSKYKNITQSGVVDVFSSVSQWLNDIQRKSYCIISGRKQEFFCPLSWLKDKNTAKHFLSMCNVRIHVTTLLLILFLLCSCLSVFLHFVSSWAWWPGSTTYLQPISSSSLVWEPCSLCPAVGLIISSAAHKYRMTYSNVSHRAPGTSRFLLIPEPWRLAHGHRSHHWLTEHGPPLLLLPG